MKQYRNRPAALQTKRIRVSLEKIGTSSHTPSSQCRLKGTALAIGVLSRKHLLHFSAVSRVRLVEKLPTARGQPTVQELYLMLDAAINLGKRLFDQQELQLQL